MLEFVNDHSVVRLSTKKRQKQILTEVILAGLLMAFAAITILLYFFSL